MMLAALLAPLMAVAGCAYPYTPRALPPVTTPGTATSVAAAPAEARAPVTILISIDGFRPDYLDRGVTPVLSRLAADGVSARMRPSFPSKTFPNHWALVTGLRPDRNGIVGNSMEDPARPGETFTMGTDDPFWWNEAEPIWVTAEKAGIRTATMFWPGANVGWGGTRAAAWPNEVTGGTRPSDWQQFSNVVSGEQRVRGVIDWLRRPAATRPRFVTLYFDTVDTAGHRFGPADPRTTQAVAAVDAQVGALLSGLAELGQTANLVIVADHGMAATSSARTIPLDTILPAGAARIFENGPFASLYPAPGREAEVAAALLKPHPHMQCWRREAIPVRFHYGHNPRVPPFFCLAAIDSAGAWQILPTTPPKPFTGGTHGYDNEAPDMAALFIANGPAFVHGRTLAPFDNVDVAPLLRDLIGLPAGSGLDGDDRPFRGAMTR
jgi:predicted AlkP superfamily pyrophosphatase or phosphodiesterase